MPLMSREDVRVVCDAARMKQYTAELQTVLGCDRCATVPGQVKSHAKRLPGCANVWGTVHAIVLLF